MPKEVVDVQGEVVDDNGKDDGGHVDDAVVVACSMLKWEVSEEIEGLQFVKNSLHWQNDCGKRDHSWIQVRCTVGSGGFWGLCQPGSWALAKQHCSQNDVPSEFTMSWSSLFCAYFGLLLGVCGTQGGVRKPSFDCEITRNCDEWLTWKEIMDWQSSIPNGAWHYRFRKRFFEGPWNCWQDELLEKEGSLGTKVLSVISAKNLNARHPDLLGILKGGWDTVLVESFKFGLWLVAFWAKTTKTMSKNQKLNWETEIHFLINSKTLELQGKQWFSQETERNRRQKTKTTQAKQTKKEGRKTTTRPIQVTNIRTKQRQTKSNTTWK